jgi:hypothetical protein
MKTPNFENFLGKHIKEFNIIENATIKHDSIFNTYVIHSEKKYDFFGNTYNGYTVSVNNKNIVNDITLYINKIIDSSFYDNFTSEYGIPNETKVGGSRVVKKEKFKDDLSTEIKETNISLKKGSFDEKPHLIKWYKENYEIQIFIKREINITEIKFSLK